MVRKLTTTLFLALLLAPDIPAPAAAQTSSVTTYHGQADRSGNFVVPGLTAERAAGVHLDPAFHGAIAGSIYAQPLYWRAPGSATGLLIVATANNTIAALNADTGALVWTRSLGQPVTRASLPCGNIDPSGITGTPAIDEATQAVYLDAFVSDSPGGGGPQHLLFGLSLLDGPTLSGWPVNVASALGAQGVTFTPTTQNQRSALTVTGGTLYVPYGGNFGDCGQYRGWVMGVRLSDPSSVTAWSTRAVGGGIWAPGGLSFDGQSLYAATGNTKGATEWGDGEAIIRLTATLTRSDQPQDSFAPSDWRDLDEEDADLGATNPLPLDFPGTQAGSALLLALGKDGKAYLLDRTNLGGIGGSLFERAVSTTPIRTAPVRFPSGNDMLVAFQADGSACPAASGGDGLVVLRIVAGASPTVRTEWCAAVDGRGIPIVTTRDGTADPIVWIVGAEGDNRLHAFRGDTGEPLLTDGVPADAMTGLRHFVTILAAQNRLYVAADGQIYAFAF